LTELAPTIVEAGSWPGCRGVRLGTLKVLFGSGKLRRARTVEEEEAGGRTALCTLRGCVDENDWSCCDGVDAMAECCFGGAEKAAVAAAASGSDGCRAIAGVTGTIVGLGSGSGSGSGSSSASGASAAISETTGTGFSQLVAPVSALK